MEANEILEGNKLIAEFMGYTYCNDGWEHLNDKNNPLHKYANYVNDSGHSMLMRDIEYNSDWNWIIPVIIEIEKIAPCRVVIDCNTCTIHKTKGKPIKVHTLRKINSVWQACIQFIKWYNQNK